MSKKAFKSIAAGLDDALADIRGESGRVTCVHSPATTRNLAKDLKLLAHQLKSRRATEEHGILLELAAARLLAQEREIAKLRDVCAEAYQLAGAYDAPVEALDNLSDAAQGHRLRHKTFLPIVP